MNEVNIEVYKHIHKTRIADLILKIQNEEFGIPITLEQQPDLNRIPEFYQVGKGNFWVGKVGDKLVGTIALLDIGNDQTALRKMFVDKNYRGKEFCIGQKLLDNSIDWARSKSVTEIFLGTTEKFVRAQRFYEKNYFIEIPKEDLPKNFPVMEVDVKFYKFSIASKLRL